jgi:hypothetical protein
LLTVLKVFRSVFTAPTFATFTALVVGMLGATGPRTITGMWSTAGLAAGVHWSRAHRFFSHARWDLDGLGLTLARALIDRLVPPEAAITVAVDDSLFHRYGRKVFGAAWQHDGSAKGRDGIGRGNCFVIVGLILTVPFMIRQICLPVLFRLHVPKTGQSKTQAARTLVDLLASALPNRRIHLVADALYRGPVWQDLPAIITFTTRLAANAVLYGPEPPRTGGRGHPRWKGDRLGTPGELAAQAAWQSTTVECYGDTESVQITEVDCLWWGSLHRKPVRVVLVRKSDSVKGYDLALVTTDLASTAQEIVARYASRWGIEQAIKDGKDLLGVGDAQNRTKTAVERTVPFMMLCLTILILWYAQAGHAPVDLAARRAAAPWYRHKHHVSVTDLLTAFRRARITGVIAAQTGPGVNVLDDLTCDATAA